MTPPPQSSTPADGVRGTQSLVHIIAACWLRPGLIARELAWRWLFGIPALLLLFSLARRLMAALAAANVSLQDMSLLAPAADAHSLAAAYAAVAPVLARTAWWLAPLLALGWAAASGIVRAYVLRALQPQARFRPGSLILLQLLRVLALAGSVAVWGLLVNWAAGGTILHLPLGAEPRTVSFAAWLICLSLGSFIVWAVWSWVLSIAAVVLLFEDAGVLASLSAALRRGAMIPRLIEVNLVLGIVKLALIVLAMVFSSIPLPFEAVMTGRALYVWWGLVAVWYLAASDFFQVVRLAAFLQLCGGRANSSSYTE